MISREMVTSLFCCSTNAPMKCIKSLRRLMESMRNSICMKSILGTTKDIALLILYFALEIRPDSHKHTLFPIYTAINIRHNRIFKTTSKYILMTTIILTSELQMIPLFFFKNIRNKIYILKFQIIFFTLFLPFSY